MGVWHTRQGHYYTCRQPHTHSWYVHLSACHTRDVGENAILMYREFITAYYTTAQCETHKRLNRFTCYRALEYAHSISVNTVLRPRDSRLKPSENSTFTTYIQRTANTHIHVPSGYSIHCTATITAIAVCVV